ncbi:antitoxin family protein [Candidatus Gracilibacteria bacterium]|nr:antitoxin family protein [Candidatus Gracilibacteria bacterium]NJM89937.1 antitoxin family protein [Hydrococcus sp. RU_2_2]NJP19851.1 antitoxin family protein [Hydrococcus sp. CRU_1_1]
MSQVVTAIFDGQVLRPDNPLELEPNKRYVITIETEQSTATTGDAWDVLEALVGSVKASFYLSIEHDRYLYGTPKHQK